MTATAEPSAAVRGAAAGRPRPGGRAWSCSATSTGRATSEGAALVRRADGQMVQLGPLMYALLECVDGRRDVAELAALPVRAARPARATRSTSSRLAEKLAAQGLLAGTEQHAPPRAQPAARAALEGARHEPARRRGG